MLSHIPRYILPVFLVLTTIYLSAKIIESSNLHDYSYLTEEIVPPKIQSILQDKRFLKEALESSQNFDNGLSYSEYKTSSMNIGQELLAKNNFESTLEKSIIANRTTTDLRVDLPYNFINNITRKYYTALNDHLKNIPINYTIHLGTSFLYGNITLQNIQNVTVDYSQVDLIAPKFDIGDDKQLQLTISNFSIVVHFSHVVKLFNTFGSSHNASLTLTGFDLPV